MNRAGFNPCFDEDTTIYHEADTIILAIGQAMDTAFLNELGTRGISDRRIKLIPLPEKQRSWDFLPAVM